MEPTVADELAMVNHERHRLWLLEKRQKERLAEIEARLAALAGDMEPGSLQLQRVKCGPSCKCNNGTGHGPYYFLYRWTKGGHDSGRGWRLPVSPATSPRIPGDAGKTAPNHSL